jgi:hypothetical protein
MRVEGYVDFSLSTRVQRSGVTPWADGLDRQRHNGKASDMSELEPTPEGLLPGSSGREELLYAGRPATIQGFGGLLLAILTLGISVLVSWIRTRGIFYKITSQRVVIEQGLFSKRMEQIDLYRVVDYVVERPLGQRIMGTGNIILEAMDKTTPEVRITGVKTDVVALYERLRYCTEQEKRKRGVRVLDVEPV